MVITEFRKLKPSYLRCVWPYDWAKIGTDSSVVPDMYSIKQNCGVGVAAVSGGVRAGVYFFILGGVGVDNFQTPGVGDDDYFLIFLIYFNFYYIYIFLDVW